MPRSPTRIELAPELQEDFDRILEHLQSHEADEAPARIDEICRAFDVLAHNPRIGRPVSASLRELVIGRGSIGYVALYRYVETIDTVFVLAVRGGRESGHDGDRVL